MDPEAPRDRSLVVGFRLAAGLLLSLPAAAAAQVCIGNPAAPGQVSAFASAEFSDGGNEYTGTVHSNLDGPLSLGGTLGIRDLDGVDENAVVSGATLTWDLPVDALPVCLLTRPEYVTWSLGATDFSSLSLPLGGAAGTAITTGGGLRIIPSAEAGLVWTRASQGDQSDSGTDAFFGAGGTLDFGRFFARASLAHVTAEGADTSFGISGGILF